MAGTSVDGIDATLVRTDGVTLERFGVGGTFAYSEAAVSMIRQAIALGDALEEQPALIGRLDECIAHDHAAAVRQLLELPAARSLIDECGTVPCIGFHGQTVLHAPQRGCSLQLGDPQRLAALLGMDVVARFRDADLAAGGEGAPLAPIYHAAVLAGLGSTGAGAFLNLGGVANLSLVVGDSLTGFDCGPGNALMDRCTRERAGLPHDAGGERALRGQVRSDIVATFLADPWFSVPPPKSLDRERFVGLPVLRELEALSIDDALATLAAVTVGAVGLALERGSVRPALLVVAGGGQHNRAVLSGLARLDVDRVMTADDMGLPGDLIEAELMAFLAARHHESLPLTFPGTTGVARPLCGGVLFRAP